MIYGRICLNELVVLYNETLLANSFSFCRNYHSINTTAHASIPPFEQKPGLKVKPDLDYMLESMHAVCSALSVRVPECQKLKMQVRPVWR